MSYQVLARKWRPRSFADMVGQGHVLKALTNALDTDRLHHAYLFTGTRGVGKTTLARILAKCMNCERGVSSTPCGECSACVGIDEGRFVDLIEVDAASRAKVEETRDLMDNVQYAPSAGRFKVYLIDEVHMFSNHSFNALLKTLEEPPPHVKFLLATTEPKKLPVTILSRCLQFNLKHLTSEQITQQLETILEQEKIPTESAANKLIAVAANGSMRDALSLLDQAIAYGNGELQEAPVRDMLGTVDSTELSSLLTNLAEGDAEGLLKRVDRMAEHTPDYDAVLAELLSSLHDIAVAQALPGNSDVVSEETRALAEKITKEDAQLFYQIALTGRRDLYMSPDPRVGFEMTMIRMLAFKPASTVSQAGGSSLPNKGSGKISHQVQVSSSAAEESAEKTEIRVKQVEEESEVITPLNGETITKDWQKIIDEMALAGLVKELAGHCVLKEHTADKVHLVLSPAQEHLLKTTQKQRLQKAINTRFGEEVKVVVTVEEPVTETPAQMRDRKEEEKQRAAVESFNNDPDVQSIREVFNATVDEGSIQPQ